MRHLVLGLVLLGGGCTLYPFGGDDGDDVCVQLDTSRPEPERKLNPDTLTCEELSSGSTCNPECGPCAGGQGQGTPPWGSCESSCTALDEAQCMAATDCRVARTWDAYYVGLPSFEGCYQTTTEPFLVRVDCSTLTTAQQCAGHDACSGLYEVVDCGVGEAEPRARFRECVDEAQIAGTCDGQVSCRAIAPTCPAATTPGVANGCWTGACIPDSLCGYASGG